MAPGGFISGPLVVPGGIEPDLPERDLLRLSGFGPQLPRLAALERDVVEPGGARAAEHGAQAGLVGLGRGGELGSDLFPVVGSAAAGEHRGDQHGVLSVAHVDVPAGEAFDGLGLYPRPHYVLSPADDVDAVLSGGDPGRLGSLGYDGFQAPPARLGMLTRPACLVLSVGRVVPPSAGGRSLAQLHVAVCEPHSRGEEIGHLAGRGICEVDVVDSRRLGAAFDGQHERASRGYRSAGKRRAVWGGHAEEHFHPLLVRHTNRFGRLALECRFAGGATDCHRHRLALHWEISPVVDEHRHPTVPKAAAVEVERMVPLGRSGQRGRSCQKQQDRRDTLGEPVHDGSFLGSG